MPNRFQVININLGKRFSFHIQQSQIVIPDNGIECTLQLCLISSFMSCPFHVNGIFWVVWREFQAFPCNKHHCGQTQLTCWKSPTKASDVSLSRSTGVFRRSSGKRGTISWVRPYPTQHCSLENSAALFCLLLFCLTDLDMGQIVVHCPFQMSKEGPNSRWWNKRAVSVRKNKKSYIDSKLILYPFMW